jgi:hypothetical protein
MIVFKDGKLELDLSIENDRKLYDSLINHHQEKKQKQ